MRVDAGLGTRCRFKVDKRRPVRRVASKSRLTGRFLGNQQMTPLRAKPVTVRLRRK